MKKTSPRVTLQVRDKKDPERWNTVHAYKNENAMVASGNWKHAVLVEHARNQLDQWSRSYLQDRDLRVWIEE